VSGFKCEIIDVQQAAQKIIPTITAAPTGATSSTAPLTTSKRSKDSSTTASSTTTGAVTSSTGHSSGGGASATTTLSICEFVPKHEGNFFVYFLHQDGTPVKGVPRSFNVRTKAQPSLELTKMKKIVVPGTF
jgi:hypothetical protein